MAMAGVSLSCTALFFMNHIGAEGMVVSMGTAIKTIGLFFIYAIKEFCTEILLVVGVEAFE